MAPSSSLESTWAAQSDLPGLNVELVEETPQGSKPGRIGEYDIVRLLGKGEFAAVFECTKANSDDPTQTYAIKAINKTKVQRHNSILKSKRNIRFQHKGICQLYDVMQSYSFVYLVLEIGERDLFNFLDDHPDGCPELVIKQIMRILALGLRHSHNAGIAHRDIKPENILVVGDPADWLKKGAEAGIVKLCDFGLCAAVHEGCMLNDFVGSPGFFAPELMMRRQYDGALADMWSIGAVMVEMLLGHRTFDNVWCPPYEHLHDVNAFSCGICEAVSRVKLGSLQTPPSEPVRKLLEQLLQIEPERRATIEQVCNASWFELLKATPNGAMQMLRLTFDRDRSSFDTAGTAGLKPFERRVAYRETPRAVDRKIALATIPSLNSDNNLNTLLSPGVGASPHSRSTPGSASPASIAEEPTGSTPPAAPAAKPPPKAKPPLVMPSIEQGDDGSEGDEALHLPTIEPLALAPAALANSTAHDDEELLRCKTPDTPGLPEAALVF